MTSQSYTPPSSSTPCPAPMTVAALLALRASNSLRVDCHYIVTDWTQGARLPGPNLVELHAISVNELSMEAKVDTPYDGVSWDGIYDIDVGAVGTMTALADNLGNVCRGNQGNEVTAFDWGNTHYTNCKVDGAIWTQLIGTVLNYNRVEVTQGGNLTTSAHTSGGMTDVKVTTGATVSVGVTATMIRTEFQNLSTLTHTGSGNLNIQKSEIEAVAAIVASGAGALVIADSKVSGSVTVSNLRSLTMTGTDVGSGCSVTVAGTTATVDTVTNCNLRGVSSISLTNTGVAASVSNNSLEGNGSAITLAGTGGYAVNGNSVEAGGIIRALATTTANFSCNDNTVEGILEITGAKGCTMSNNKVGTGSVIREEGTAGASDVCTDNTLTGGAVIKMAVSGANNNVIGNILNGLGAVTFAVAPALAGYAGLNGGGCGIFLIGTSSRITVRYNELDRGSIWFNSFILSGIGAAFVSDNTIDSGSSLVLAGITDDNSNVNQNRISQNSILVSTQNAATTNIDVVGNDLSNGAKANLAVGCTGFTGNSISGHSNINATVGSVTDCEVRTRSTLNVNGGAQLGLQVAGSSTATATVSNTNKQASGYSILPIL